MTVARLILLGLVLFVSVGPSEARAAAIGYDGSEAPRVSWGTVIGDDDPVADQIDGVAIDDRGNTVISGVFFNRVRIGTETLTSRGEGDIFLASYSPEGKLNWLRQIGGPGDDNTFDLRVDGQGNPVASGWFSDRVDFGGTTLESAGSVDMFVARFDPDGNLRWAQRFGGPRGDGGNELDVLANGEIAVAALSDGPFTAGGITYPFGGGSRDSYLLRIGAGGELRWVRPFNGPGTERIRAVAMNPAGEAFVGFEYRVSVTSGGQTVTSAGNWDGALAKLAPDGSPQWLLGAGGTGVDNVRGAAAGPDGSIYASGQFTGASRILGVALNDDGAGDDYLMRLSPSGLPIWTATIGGPGQGVGGEIRSWRGGVIVSSLINGNQTIAGPGGSLPLDFVGTQTSYAAGFTSEGRASFAYFPEPVGGGAAPGGALAVTEDGRDIAYSIRIRGQLALDAEKTLNSPTGDSALIRLVLPRSTRPISRARVRIVRLSPRRIALRRGRPRLVRVRIKNSGEATAKGLRVCLRGRCRRTGSLRGGWARVVKLRLRRGTFRGAGHRRLRVRVYSGNAGRDSARLVVRLRGTR